MRPAALLLLALTALAPGCLAAQAVSGTVVDERGGTPVVGALVSLLSADGRVRASTLADGAGRFSLRAPAAGRYTLRAERIGYASRQSPALELLAGETLSYRLAAPQERVALEALVATADTRRCAVRPGAGDETSLLWDEARKALRSAQQTRAQYPYHFRTQRRARRLDPATGTVVSEQVQAQEGFSDNPFVSAPPAQLARYGYVETHGDTVLFHAPDADVLLSESFLEAHCFRARRGDGDHRTMVGLAFEPVGGADLPDVEGVLWMDAASAELRTLEYRYVRYAPAEGAGVGGKLEFRRLPNGGWIIPRWRILMPVVGQAPVAAVPATGIPSVQSTRTAQRQSLAEEVGEVVEVRGRDGVTVEMVAYSTLRGVVYDSIGRAPLAGAHVTLAGTAYAADADSAGRYTLTRVPEGAYSLSFTHPRLEALHFAPDPVRVAVVPPQEVVTALGVPSLATILTASCNVAPGSAVGALAGVVSDRQSGTPLVGVPVHASWSPPGAAEPSRVISVTDARGGYHFCELPASLPVRISASAQGDSAVAQVTPRTGAPQEQDLQLTAPMLQSLSVQSAGEPMRVLGRVVDASNFHPVEGVVVRFGGVLPERTTNRRGEFVLEQVPPGNYALEFTHPRYGNGTSRLTAQGRGTLEFELRLPRRTVMLEPLAVTARRVYPGDFNIRSRGRTLNLITREQIQAHLAASRHVGDLLRTVPGLVVREIFFPNSQQLKEVCLSDRTALGQGSLFGDTPQQAAQLDAQAAAPRRPQSPALAWMGSECHGADVVLDDMVIGVGVGEFLRDFPINEIESLIYLKPGDAMGRYGSQGANGLLLIYTRGNGPTADAGHGP